MSEEMIVVKAAMVAAVASGIQRGLRPSQIVAEMLADNAIVSAYNPNERLREAAKELLSRVDSFAREIAEPAFFSERETLRAALEAVK